MAYIYIPGDGKLGPESLSEPRFAPSYETIFAGSTFQRLWDSRRPPDKGPAGGGFACGSPAEGVTLQPSSMRGKFLGSEPLLVILGESPQGSVAHFASEIMQGQ